MPYKLLTKSKYLIGMQCPKLLWIMFHQPEKIPEVDASTQYRFDQGELVGQLAKKLYPKGVDISYGDFKTNLDKTKELLKQNLSLFEAGVVVGRTFARADILVPNKEGWDIVEVKSSTSVKDENIQDVSFQKYVYEQSGLKIKKCSLLHLNNEYVKKGEIDPKKLFILEDISKEVEEASIGIKERIDEMLKIIDAEKMPCVKISNSCHNPYECLVEECWEHMPEHNVFHLYRIGKKAFDLVENGILALEDVPSDTKLTEIQQIQLKCAKGKCPHVNKTEIKKFLSSLEEPLHFLDFETFATAIPLFDGTRPYQAIPFQFSLHVDDKHHSFLALNKDDPRKDFLNALKKAIGPKGSIIVYNQSFEQGRLRELASIFPKEKAWIESVIARMVDLLIPFRNFHYYHPQQKGSASIKEVLPALTGKSYSEMEIGDGGTASLSFLTMVQEDLPEKEKLKIKKDLEDYCGLDTEGMVWIIEKLRGMVR
ncbi:MAG: DUF2779 domain-containing protein [Nanoarchaeota archaeon]